MTLLTSNIDFVTDVASAHHRIRAVPCRATVVSSGFLLSYCVQVTVHDLQAQKGQCCVVSFPLSAADWISPSTATASPCPSTRSSKCPGSDDEAHNIWNPVVGLCCH